MGKLSHIKGALEKKNQKAAKELDKTLTSAVSNGITPALAEVRALEKALETSVGALNKNQGKGAAASIKAVQDASAALSGPSQA